MSTHKHIDKICCMIMALTLLLTVVFLNGKKLGITETVMASEYESQLFDTSSVHTIDIVMDDWEGFLETCTNEEYTICSVVIDQEACQNVAIRAKGNTSLSQVESYGNDRYSFKIEFDYYDSSQSYYGLDKLCLNNIIQDNTYMKDFLCYQMMSSFGVSAPLCSYAYITVNGEDWGLYLAVEGVEESFLESNYGSDYGELYKPDSQSMGGGKGNGKEFDMDEIMSGESGDDIEMPQDGLLEENGDGQESTQNYNESERLKMGESRFREEEATEESQNTLREMPSNGQGTEFSPEEGGMFGAFEQGEGAEGFSGSFSDEIGDVPGAVEEGVGGGENSFQGGMSSSDVSLIYTDDAYSSYQNIFENAKTSITAADKDRLIASLKQLNAGENIEEVVNVDEVLRYFVVHNFVCNFDSYTGSMIHNYYLYEEDGQLSMIPWDYNLAFGGFMGEQDATELVNYPIDTPVSGGSIESRPMLAWIFSDETYTELYHQYFAEFIETAFDSGEVSELIETTKELIAPYVEEDPTKFCTYEEFQTGVETLQSFCQLRAESITEQLAGTIPATQEEQEEQADARIDASDIDISAMGSMNGSVMGAGNDSVMGGWNEEDMILPQEFKGKEE